MPLERPILAAKRAKRNVKMGAVGRLPWIDTFRCTQCGAYCEMSETYDPAMAGKFAETNGVRPSWFCPFCDQHYRREPDEDEDEDTFDTYDRRTRL